MLTLSLAYAKETNMQDKFGNGLLTKLRCVQWHQGLISKWQMMTKALRARQLGEDLTRCRINNGTSSTRNRNIVTNIELRKHVRKIEAFIDLANERLDGPTLMDLLTHIYGMKIKCEVFHLEFGLYRTDIKDNIKESLSFCKATTLQLEELSVLRSAIASSGSTREKSSKVKILEPKSFMGIKSAKKLRNFLRDMKKYFIAAHVRDEDKVSINNALADFPLGREDAENPSVSSKSKGKDKMKNWGKKS
uniref:Polyprotein, related n=1 Tax=Solanum demissum TaxID=50514 RepID=Q60D36_SOLDE|nr:polyprotein, related [Solanum demissum]